jgi:hypothetical protein
MNACVLTVYSRGTRRRLVPRQSRTQTVVPPCSPMAEGKSGADMAETVIALKVSAPRRLSSPGAQAKIALSSLPPHVAKMLASMDSDGDGTLDWEEIFAGAQAHKEAVSKSKVHASPAGSLAHHCAYILPAWRQSLLTVLQEAVRHPLLSVADPAGVHVRCGCHEWGAPKPPFFYDSSRPPCARPQQASCLASSCTRRTPRG